MNRGISIFRHSRYFAMIRMPATAVPKLCMLQLMTTNMAAYPDPLIGDPTVTINRKLLSNNTKTTIHPNSICLQNFPSLKSSFFLDRLKPEAKSSPRLFTSRSAMSVTPVVLLANLLKFTQNNYYIEHKHFTCLLTPYIDFIIIKTS